MKKLALILILSLSISGCCTGIIKATKNYATVVKDTSSAAEVFLKDIKCEIWFVKDNKIVKEKDADCIASKKALETILKSLRETSEKILGYKKKW
jgi:hypothetical protein